MRERGISDAGTLSRMDQHILLPMIQLRTRKNSNLTEASQTSAPCGEIISSEAVFLGLWSCPGDAPCDLGKLTNCIPSLHCTWGSRAPIPRQPLSLYAVAGDLYINTPRRDSCSSWRLWSSLLHFERSLCENKIWKLLGGKELLCRNH
jgi:hypothetical protein